MKERLRHLALLALLLFIGQWALAALPAPAQHAGAIQPAAAGMAQPAAEGHAMAGHCADAITPAEPEPEPEPEPGTVHPVAGSDRGTACEHGCGQCGEHCSSPVLPIAGGQLPSPAVASAAANSNDSRPFSLAFSPLKPPINH